MQILLKFRSIFKRISIEASEHRVAYISPPICFNQLNFGLHLVLFKIYTSLHTTLSRADPENYDRGGRDTRPLYRYFLLSWEFYKNNTKFQRKKGWLRPSRPYPRSALDCDCLGTRVGQQDKILLSTKQHLGEVYSACFLSPLPLSLPLGFSTDNLQGCCLMVARSTEALVHGWLRFQTTSPHRDLKLMILMAIASMLLPMNEWQNSLLNMRFWNDNVKCVFVDYRQKISAGKSKQTSTFLETPNSNKSSFEHLLTYLSLSINGLLEMWLQLLTFYFKILKYFLRQQPCCGRMTGDFAEAHSWVALLCQSCEHCSI